MKFVRCWGYFLFLSVCLGLTGLPNCSAVTNSWTWGGSGFWRFGTNWSLGAPGTNSSHVQIINSGLSKTIILEPNALATNRTINGLIVASAGTKSNWLVVSNLTASNPLRILGSALIGGPDNNQGRLIVTNSTVILDAADNTNDIALSISNGLVLLQPGGEIILTNGVYANIGLGATGAMTIATNSALRIVSSNLVVGGALDGIGNMTVSGGTVDVGFTFTIGDDMTSTGNVVVANGLLRAVNTNANTEIGQHGGGQLTLSNGVCQFDDVSVGRHADSHGTLRIFNGLFTGSDLSMGRFTNSFGAFFMTGGQVQLSGGLYAGREGTGTVSVTGGSVQAQDLLVACTNGAHGAATFSGGTSVFSSLVCIGNLSTTGAVSISGGTFVCTNSGGTSVVDVIRGILTVTNSTVVFDEVFATNSGGRIALNGGSISAKQFTVRNGLPFTVGAGTNAMTLRLSDGLNVFSNGLVVASNATVVGSGAIYGSVVNSGRFIADGANTSLIFYGAVTNNRIMIETNGGRFEFHGPLVNNGTIVSNSSPPVIVSFTAGPTNGLAPLTVLFTNLSSGATNYAWDFGDGKTSAVTNPTNTFTNAATYTVKLTAFGAGGSNSLIRTGYIVVTNPPPPVVVAGFIAGPTNGLAPLTVLFTNLSSGATNYAWEFGDGKTSAVANPTNTYTNAATYTVKLTAFGASGSNSLTRTNYVVVTNLVTDPPPVVSFTAGPTNGLAPLTVLFTNLSSGATNYVWDFGDGNTSAVANPTNTYTNAATYTVKLTAFGAGGSNSLTRTSYIVVTNSLLLTPSRITDFRRTGTTNQISFTTIAGVTYAVEATITLTNSSWFIITNNFPGNNATNSINDDTATNDTRFYRIKGQ